MRRTSLFAALSVGLVALGLGPASAVSTPDATGAPGPGGFTSANVTWVTHLPGTEQGVSGRVVQVGTQKRFYTTGAKGLFIFDITKPEAPVRLGFLALPHLQNEDVSVSDDGKRVVIGADGGLLLPLNVGTGIHVIDTSDPAAPKKVGFHADSNHTASCADAACNFVYGSEGGTYDLTDPTAPKKLATGWRAFIASAASSPRITLTQGAHDLSRDDTGLVSADTIPRVILDPRVDPTRPKLVTSGLVPASKNLAYQHNSERPDALLFDPRDTPEEIADPALRPGELLLANGETNLVPRCNGNGGPLASWSLRDMNKGLNKMAHLETFRPLANGTYADSNPAVNALGCSGHYFDERNGVVAAAWFEHGVRFIKVDKTNGKFTEVGWWQPVATSAGAAYWVDDEYVYVTDYVRGVDVLKFNRSAPAGTADDAAASWLAPVDPAVAELVAREQYMCKAGAGD